MKLLIFGATGGTGREIASQANAQGHGLTLFVRDPAKATLPGARLVRGDVLRDQPTTPDAVLAGGEAILHVLASRDPVNPEPCIRCGWCAQACPTQVLPAGVLEAAQRLDLDLAERSGVHACVECGICTYVCPSHLPLLGGIRAVKKELLKAAER